MLVNGYSEQLYQKFDSHIKSLESGVREGEVRFFFHPDGDGLSTQALTKKLFRELYGLKVSAKKDFYPITYELSDRAVNIANSYPRETLFFEDYYPHPQEFSQFLKNGHVKRVVIWDKHIGREGIDGIKEKYKGVDFDYLNPRDYQKEDFDFKLGTPIGFLLGVAARRNKIDSRFLQDFALRSYGFYGELRDLRNKAYLDVKANYEAVRRIIESVLLYCGHKIENSFDVVDILSEAKNYEDAELKEIHNICQWTKLPEKKAELSGYARRKKKEFGDFVFFPISEGFEQLKPFASVLTQQARKYKFNTTLISNLLNSKIKFSLRTDREDISFRVLLEHAYASLPVDIERNYGAHEKAAGGVCSKNHFPLVASAILNEYMKIIGKDVQVDKTEFYDLYVDVPANVRRVDEF